MEKNLAVRSVVLKDYIRLIEKKNVSFVECRHLIRTQVSGSHIGGEYIRRLRIHGALSSNEKVGGPEGDNKLPGRKEMPISFHFPIEP
jgi:hypothetical protein